jgi:hypothetical protein
MGIHEDGTTGPVIQYSKITSMAERESKRVDAIWPDRVGRPNMLWIAMVGVLKRFNPSTGSFTPVFTIMTGACSVSFTQCNDLASSHKRATVLLVLLLSFAGCDSRQEPISLDPIDYPYRFSPMESEPSINTIVGFHDLDGDGIDEKVLLSCGERINESLVLCTTHDGRTINQVNLPPTKSAAFCLAPDLNKDGKEDLFVVTKERDALWGRVIDLFGSTSVTREFPLFRKPKNLREIPGDAAAFPIGVTKDKNDRTVAVCLFVGQNKPLAAELRSIRAFDVQSGESLWVFPTAAWPA